MQVAGRHLGWKPPTLVQHARNQLRAGAGGDTLLFGIDAAPEVDLTDITVLLDQLALGSCTANAWAQICYMAMVKAGVEPYVASRLALYFWARKQDGLELVDSGSAIGTVAYCAAGLGLPRETVWPYMIEHFAATPGPEAYRDAHPSRALIGVNYHPISSSGDALVQDIEKALTAGHGVAFGVDVSAGFCSGEPSDIVHRPSFLDEIAGGHALTVCGYNHAREYALVKNSWGDWRDKSCPPGVFRMGYDYLRTARDVWMITTFPKKGAQAK